MGEAARRQSLKVCHRIRAEGLYSFAHMQGPPAIERQQPRVPSQVSYDESAIHTRNVMSTHT